MHFGKSFRTKKERELINLEKENAFIEINFQKSDRTGKIELSIGEGKRFKINGVKINKLSELLGNLYIVLFNPDNMSLLKDGPSERRKFLDIMISQLKAGYVFNLNQYMKTLEQRNIYLNQIRTEHKPEEMLEIWDEKLVEYGQKVYEYRFEFIEKIKEKINKFHSPITEEKERISIKYISHLKDVNEYRKKLKETREIDIKKGFTGIGIHRDDFEIKINDKLVSVYGSQGQQRTTVISLKLTELEIIYDEIGEYPILLLDDFMSELDDKRIHKFLENIKQNQVIITCTDKIKLENTESNFYKVENGKIAFKN